MKLNSIIKCKNCGKEFEKISPNRKYCSKYCAKRFAFLNGGREKYNEWMRKNPEKYLKYSKQFKNEHPKQFKKSRQIADKKRKEIANIRKKDRAKATLDKCKICKSTFHLEIHHITYKPSKYIILCYNCHMKEHGRRCLKSL